MIARADRAREAGQSLVEMLVVVSIFLLVMATITGAFLTVQRSSDEIDNRFENTGEAQKLISALTKDLRTATPLSAGASPFLVADKRRITFYGNLNFVSGATPRFPNKIDLLIDATIPAAPVLKEYIWVPTNNSSTTDAAPNYTAAATSLRLVGQYVANAATDPIFRYFDGAGAELGLPTSVPPASLPLVPADQIKVRTIKIALAVRKQTTRSVQPMRVESTIRLANVIYGNLTAS
jgi:type II secretory pathway pseudopilin PulG